jgi:hypothetical protein
LATGWSLQIGPHGALIDYSAYTDAFSWRCSRSTRHRGATANARIVIPNKAVVRPKCLNECVLVDRSTGQRHFGGIVQRVEQSIVTGRQSLPSPEPNSGAYEYALSIADYTRWLDHIPTPLGKDYAGGVSTYITDIVLAIFADCVTQTGTVSWGVPGPACPLTASYDVDRSGVVRGGHVSHDITVQITSYAPNGQSVSSAFDDLAKLVDAIWYVDINGDLWFVNPDSTLLSTAPLPVQSHTYYEQDFIGYGPRGPVSLPTLDVDNDTTNYSDLRVAEDASNITTGCSPIGFVPVSDVVLTEGPASLGVPGQTVNPRLVGDGTTNFFPLSNDPVDPAHTTVTVGGTKVYSVGNGNMKTEYVDGQPGDGNTADWCYVCTTNFGIRFGQAPANGAVIRVDYNWYGPPTFQTIIAGNLASIVAAREGFGPGYYWQTLDRSQDKIPWAPHEVPVTPWVAAAQILLHRYARIKILATFNSYTKGWAPGQTFFLLSANRGDNAAVPTADAQFTGWGTTLLVKMYVTQTEESIVNDSRLLTRVEACSDLFGL